MLDILFPLQRLPEKCWFRGINSCKECFLEFIFGFKEMPESKARQVFDYNCHAAIFVFVFFSSLSSLLLLFLQLLFFLLFVFLLFSSLNERCPFFDSNFSAGVGVTAAPASSAWKPPRVLQTASGERTRNITGHLRVSGHVGGRAAARRRRLDPWLMQAAVLIHNKSVFYGHFYATDALITYSWGGWRSRESMAVLAASCAGGGVYRGGTREHTEADTCTYMDT